MSISVIYENVETFYGKMPERGPPSLGQESKGALAK